MKFIRTEISDRIATVTFDRPPVNALNAQVFREIAQAFDALGKSQEASVAIFTAPGEKMFCAGVDLTDSSRRHSRTLVEDDTAVDLLDPGALPRSCFWALHDCPLPVIGAINGAAIGAGLVLAACCDILIVSEKASFTMPQIKVGVLGGGRALQRMVGSYKARRTYFTGEPLTPQELYRLGAAEAVVPPDQLMPAAMELATKIAKNSPIGLRLAKESFNRVEYLDLKEAYRLEQDYTSRVLRYQDSAEARASFKEKRKPNWSWS